MGKLLSRLVSVFSGNNKSSRKRRREMNRRLAMEPMEARRLLVGDIATISGNVFTDVLDDGLTGDDVAISGVTVHLYEDGGNGTFDSGSGVAGGDDTLLSTDTSDGSGDYSFADLEAGTYFVEQIAAAGQLQRPAETVKTVVISAADAAGIETSIIDSANEDFALISADSGTPATNAVQDTAATVGSERDVVINYTSGPGSVTVQVASGVLNVAAASGVVGNAIISYDGDDNDATSLNHSLLNLDLTASGGNAFGFLVGGENGASMTMDVFSGSGNFSSFSSVLPDTGGSGAIEDMIIRFSDFTSGGGTGADFSAVTAIRIQVDLPASADAQFDFNRVVAPFVNSQDFANLNPMSLGDLVFNDADNSGTLNGGEAGISGVEVELYEDTNGNDAFDDGTDALVDTQTTDGSGNYLFDDLLPGDYIAVIRDSQFATGADPLFGFVTSTGNDPAPDPDSDPTNNDDNGTALASVGVVTAVVTLASGTEPTTDGDNDTNSDLSVDFGFAPTVDVAVTKTAGVSTINAGEQLTYTIAVTNNGPNTATNVVVVDDLPDDFSIVSATTTGGGVVTQTGNTSGEISVSFASLTSGQSETITVVVGVPEDRAAATAVRNSVTATSDGNDSNTANNSDTADVDITRSATLTLSKTDTPDPVSVGSNLTYEILVTNTGPSSATNVSVSDTLPAGLNFVSVNATTGNAVEASGVITVTIPTLAVNASSTITVVATVDSGFTGSTITNTATASADEAQTVTANESTDVDPAVDLSITKADDVDPVNRGSQLVYTLVVANAGPSDATNVEVVDTLPDDVTFVSASGGTVSGPNASGEVTVDVGNLASGNSTTVTITVNVDSDAPATISNSAIVRSTESTAGHDTDTTNNSTSENTATQTSIDLEITKADSVDPVLAGQSLVYTLTVTNNGPSDAPLVVVTDDLPDGIQVNSATSTVGTVTVPSSAQDTNATNNDDLTVDVGTLVSGASATVTINATVLPEITGTLSNVATVSTTDTSVTETDTTNNSATEDTTVNAQIDLAVSKVDSVDPAIAGGALTYTVTVTNNGPSTATGVVLSDNLPSGVTFTSATPSQGTASEASGTVTAQLGTLAPGASATVAILVGVDGDTRGVITNNASVTATQSDSNTANNTTSEETTVNGNVDVAITKVDDSDPVVAGGMLQYTIVVTNNGPSTATNVVMTDTVPADLTITGTSTTVGTVSDASNVVTANIGTLASGASATIVVDATVSATATGTLTNTASVTATETETDTTNNSATQTTAIAEVASLSGMVYLDANQNGVFDTGETGIEGVIITLTGTDSANAAVNRQATTDANGEYVFDDLVPGTYALAQTQPANLRDGEANVGTGATGTAGDNEITDIVLASGANAVQFNFGEFLSPFSKRRFLASTQPGD